jgi:hypothetical protein
MLSVLDLGSDEEDGLRYGEVMTDIRIAQVKGTEREEDAGLLFIGRIDMRRLRRS